MADKKGKGAAKKAPAEEAEADEKHEHDEAEKPVAAKDAHAKDAHAKDAHAKDAHGKAPHGAHGHHKPNIREYLIIFGVLTALTVLEVLVAQVPGISKGLLAIALIGLALTKAGIVGLYYMHLKHETRILKLTVMVPMAAPAIYALVLISEAAWRLARF
jgi:caa(3)-type oxidase subunit IV